MPRIRNRLTYFHGRYRGHGNLKVEDLGEVAFAAALEGSSSPNKSLLGNSTFRKGSEIGRGVSLKVWFLSVSVECRGHDGHRRRTRRDGHRPKPYTIPKTESQLGILFASCLVAMGDILPHAWGCGGHVFVRP